MPQIIHEERFHAETTDEIPLPLHQYEPPPDSAFDVEVRAHAKQVGGTGRGTYIGRFGVDRTNSNPPIVTGVGSLEKFTVGQGSNWKIEVVVVGNEVLFNVEGQSGIVVRWSLYVNIQNSAFS